MARQARIRVSINGGRLVEGRVQSALTRGGETVERVERRLGTAGEREHLFSILLVEGRPLDQVIRAVEGVKGAAVIGATLFGPKAPSKASGESSRG